MNYGNIPTEVLNMVTCPDLIDENLQDSLDLTLKDEIDRFGQDVIEARWIVEDEYLIEFTCWTKDLVLILVDGMFPGEKHLVAGARNP